MKNGEISKLMLELSDAYSEVSYAIYEMEQKNRICHQNILKAKAHLSECIYNLNCKIHPRQSVITEEI